MTASMFDDNTAAQSGEAKADGLDTARRALRVEADALHALADGLGDEFLRAVELLGAIQGRVIVTGMGKSGHVGRKIAATLASTGTPAFFVHPGEASHGDLGMITRQDAVVGLSNSGETPELGDIVAFCRRFAIPLVAMTGRAGSTLAQAADVALVLPEMPEACPIGMAPTTSTTMMLALGDALAVTLLARQGFTVADFKTYHPGGQLGRRLLRVADLMHTGESVPLVPRDMRMGEALVVMTRKSFGCVGVTDDGGRLVGVVTDGDLRRHLGPQLIDTRVAEVMTPHPKKVPPRMLAAEALHLMNENAITSLFVVEADERPRGILHVHDCLRAGVT